jgi:hypothetical protein
VITLNKGLTGAIKVTLIFLVLLISTFFIFNFIPTFAESSASIWTTDVYGNPKTDFAPEETVYIHGSNFLANNNVDVSITRPDGTIDSGNSFSDEIGSFVYNYQLDGIEGLYNVFATDGTNTAETTFTDSFDVNTVCKDLGFDFGVVKWEWKSGWSPDGGDNKGTSVTGSNTVTNWSVGTSVADGIVVKAGSTVLYAVNGENGTVYQSSPATSFIAFCGYNETCNENEKLTEFTYESKPNTVHVDNSTTNVSFKLCNSTEIPVDTSDGKEHYIYMNWSLGDISGYKGAVYFDLMLYHKEDSTFIKVQLKNQSGAWINVCDSSESSSYIWSTCNLKPYWNILKNVPVIQLRVVAKNSGACHEYLGCAKLKVKMYKCEPTEYCGDGIVKPPEECEIGNKETKQCGTDVGICEFGEKERECTQNCKWGNWSECKGGINPQPEICDGLDNDCGGHVDEGCCPSYSCLTPDELGDTQQENIKHGYGVNDDLQKLLDSYGYAINATEDQTNDQIWHIDADTVNIQIELVGKGAADNSNVFGYYLNGNASNFTPLFQMGNHSVYHVPVFTHGQKINITIKNVQDIGFGINSENKNQTQRYLYLTQNSSNPDSKDHAIVFDLCNNTYMIGFEDIYNLGDSDYEDLVVIVRVINCTSGPVCGDSIVKPPEQCELPNTINNTFCIQTTTECLGKKFGQRDAYGNCDEFCGCIDDPFQYSCVKDKCGAECGQNLDCQSKCEGIIWKHAGTCLDNCVCSYTETNCNDNNKCTNDNCDNILGCQHTPVNCDDGDVCTEDSCDPSTGCKHTSIPNCCKTDGECNDNNACTNDVCASNQCQHNKITCDDKIGCTEDTCDTIEGCVYTPNDNKCPTDTTCADYYCDAKLDCQVSYTPLSTPCEADGNKCTLDHCNGLGSCVFKENVPIPPAEQCKSFYCDPADGKIKEDYTAYPLSIPCNADGKFCTVDHCDGKGTCVFWKDYDCSGYNLKEIAQCNWIPDNYLATFDYSQSFTSTCDEVNDKCTEGSQPLTHTCADANSSDGGPVIPIGNGIRTCDAECDGFGIECQNKCIDDVWYFNGNCNTNPSSCKCSYQSEDCNKDGCYAYDSGCEMRDYFCQLTGCNYTYSDRHTDFYDGYVNYCSADTIRTHRALHDFFCDFESSCNDHPSFVNDSLVEDCNLQDGWYNTSTTQWLPVGECADKEQKEQEYRDYTCKDAACDYKVTKYQWVDTGNMKYKELSTPCEADGNKCTIDHCNGLGSCVKKEDVDCSGLNNQCQEGVCNPSDGKCYPDYAKFPLSTPCEADSSKCTIDHCDGKGLCLTFDNVPVPAPKECNSFYCDPTDGKVKENYTAYPLSTPCEADDNKCTIDHCDGVGECVFWKDVPTPSKPIKIIGDPKTLCQEGEWCEWKITTLTPITLTCDIGKVKWRYALDGDWKEWHTDGSTETIYFPEESNHTLEAYCIDDCGESIHDIEKFKVEGTAFEIPLYKKWNLISVPFALINDSISEVFKNITDKIISVWTYDNGVWYTWIPCVGGTLTSIKPGWGYWVLANNDTELLIAGNLFSPVTTPPSKDLQSGWNLIGYYGTEWQTYELEKDNVCGYINPNYGGYTYCSLNSLINTQQGFPRWSSLWGYDNCGNDVAYWHELESCISDQWSDNMLYAGKGYWIEMDVKDSYAPATNCIWDKDLKCSHPTL